MGNHPQGSLPKDCEDQFNVNASGSTEEEARNNAYMSARRICTVHFPDKCSGAEEIGTGKWEKPDKEYIYYGTYRCRIEL